MLARDLGWLEPRGPTVGERDIYAESTHVESLIGGRGGERGEREREQRPASWVYIHRNVEIERQRYRQRDREAERRREGRQQSSIF